MDRISTFNATADLAALQSALTRADAPAPLREPLQALVVKITEAVAARPVSLYVTSADEVSALRDHFAYLLARTLAQHMPSTLLVDCDFVNVGLHGLVPERDALGFLDLLLYGSSLGVITQDAAAGVKVVGAGSFPVTKRMPFVVGAFDGAARRLIQHARCVVFVGPLYDDEGALHPLLGEVSHPVLVRELTAARPGAIDPIEEQIASQFDLELFSVRLLTPPAAPAEQTFTQVLGDETEDVPPPPSPPVGPPPPPSPKPIAPPPPARPPAATEETRDAAPPADPVRRRSQGAGQFLPRDTRTRRSSLGVGLAAVAVLLVAVGWWWSTRGGGEPPTRASDAPRREQASQPTPIDPSPRVLPADTETTMVATAESVDTTRSSPPPTRAAEEAPPPVAKGARDYVDPADTGGRSGGTVLISSEDIHVMGELETNWRDHYFIHISSFRRSVEARNEVAYLENLEFPVFVVFLDLGAKGNWYRVYAGPFKTRDEAREVKKSLDDIPRVRFTRITKIPG